jgi:hypothetical protein
MMMFTITIIFVVLVVLFFKFKLNKNYTHFDGYNCSGIFEGNTVYLDKPISPYGFVFFSVEN